MIQRLVGGCWLMSSIGSESRWGKGQLGRRRLCRWQRRHGFFLDTLAAQHPRHRALAHPSRGAPCNHRGFGRLTPIEFEPAFTSNTTRAAGHTVNETDSNPVLSRILDMPSGKPLSDLRIRCCVTFWDARAASARPPFARTARRFLVASRDSLADPRWAIERKVTDRATQLALVVESLRSLGAGTVEVEIFTNASEQSLLGLTAPGHGHGTFSLRVVRVPAEQLTHPHSLAWAHMEASRRYLEHMTSNDLFVYLEDDILFSRENLLYWLSNRQSLAQHGLFASFARVEFSRDHRNWVSSDLQKPTNLDVASKLDLEESSDWGFVELENPYCAMYVLDAELAREFVDSPWFANESLRFVDWDTRERAASGLLFRNVPQGFTSRGVVRYRKSSLTLDSGALVHHLGNTYANRRRSAFGTVPIDHALSAMPVFHDAQSGS